MKSKKGIVLASLATVVLLAATAIILLVITRGYRSIVVDALKGSTTITNGSRSRDAVQGQKLKDGDDVAVGKKSSLTLALDSDKHVYANELTHFQIKATGKAGKDSKTVIRLEKGSILNKINEKLGDEESYTVDTPNASMSVRGTKFRVTVTLDEEDVCHTLVEVEKGSVKVKNKETGKTYVLTAEEQMEIIAGVADEEPLPSQFFPPPQTPAIIPTPTPQAGVTQPDYIPPVYLDPDILAVEAAIQTYLDGGELDTANFDMVTSLLLFGDKVLVNSYGIHEDNFVEYNIENKRYNGRHFGRLNLGVGITPDEYDNALAISVYIVDYDQTAQETIVADQPGTYQNLDFLSEMKNLTLLQIYFNPNLSDLSGVAGLPKLFNMILSYTNISEDSPELAIIRENHPDARNLHIEVR